MQRLGYFLNEQNVIDQIRYYLIPNFGEDEFTKLIDANPIAMLDGILYFCITTKEEPKGTTPTSIEKTNYGWISKYAKSWD
jgi:hypothetical protein